MKTSIEFINHASVIVSDGKTSVLSDPWYTGDVFHKGWNLLHETSYKDVLQILDRTTHIWISHEHPDHFSILFFKSFAQKIKERSILILFQKTKDKRVLKFFSAQGFDIQELEFNKQVSISKNYTVTCIKDGFHDSGLLIESNSEKILNLNDCDIRTETRANEVLAETDKVDVLLTQFSFAAWKGGKQNKKWRDEAAAEKIKTIQLQIKKFKPKIIIPFASFIYFSNYENFYLNDAVNKPRDIAKKLENKEYKILIMAPFDKLGGGGNNYILSNEKAISFWEKKYSEIKPTNKYETIYLDQLKESFYQYCERIHKNNNMRLIKIIRALSPIRTFNSCSIHLKDLKIKVKFDYVNKTFQETTEVTSLSMQSESLYYIFKNSFGFDTLTVNGCFEEMSRNGFVNATKTLAIEKLNNLGIKLELKTLINFSIIKLILTRLYRVARKLDN